MNTSIMEELQPQKKEENKVVTGGVVISDNPKEKFFVLTSDGKTIEVESQVEVARFFRNQKRC